jgi:RNA recognition motif-containing protein
METKLYVGSLPYETSEEDLRVLFAQAGGVESVDLIKDRDTGRSKGFAFVIMKNQSELEKAIQMFNNYSLGGRQLVVNIARPREERNDYRYNDNRNRGRKQSNRGGSRRY